MSRIQRVDRRVHLGQQQSRVVLQQAKQGFHVVDDSAGARSEEGGLCSQQQGDNPWIRVQKRRNKVWKKRGVRAESVSEPCNASVSAAEADMRESRGPSSRDIAAEANKEAIRFPPSKVAPGDFAGLVSEVTESGTGGDAAVPACDVSSSHDLQLVRSSRPGVGGIAQSVEKRVVEPSSLRMAIESSFMRRIRSSIEDYVCQVYGHSLSVVPPTSYRRSLSVDDSEVPLQPVLALPWEEYRRHPDSVMPAEPEDIENVNREISAHIISLQKARDSTRRVTRSAIKSIPDSIINDA